MIVLATACSGAPRATAHPESGPHPAGGSTTGDAASVSGAGTPGSPASAGTSGASGTATGSAATGAPTTTGTSTPATASAGDRCAKLIAHAVELGVAERPPEQQLTAGERATIEAQLRTQLAARCTRLGPRELDCALGARTLAAMQACDGS